MFKNQIFTALFTIVVSVFCNGQTMVANGASIFIANGGNMLVNGGLDINTNASFTNNGTLKITKNSTFPIPGTIAINSSSTVGGTGDYYIEQDWINNATFNSSTSYVELYGNTQQFITSTNATVTTFNDLALTGNGVGNNRKKTLSLVDAKVSSTGSLAINNRELETQSNTFFVQNPSVVSVSNSTTFGSEGFVSSLTPGMLERVTNSSNSYVFPVGSSDITLRYRPISIITSSSSNQEYAVRMNNYNSDNDGYNRTQTDGSIASANDKFYHSIERVAGTGSVDLEFSYLPSSDGDWTSTAQWTNAAKWESLINNTSGNSTNYSTVLKNAWDFSPSNLPYILTNILDELSIPNVFTVNGDGINDLFDVTLKNISDYSIFIVNRWGNVVFESTDITKSWDGTFNNELCTEGTYFYQIKATSKNNTEYNKQGFIYLKY